MGKPMKNAYVKLWLLLSLLAIAPVADAQLTYSYRYADNTVDPNLEPRINYQRDSRSYRRQEVPLKDNRILDGGKHDKRHDKLMVYLYVGLVIVGIYLIKKSHGFIGIALMAGTLLYSNPDETVHEEAAQKKLYELGEKVGGAKQLFNFAIGEAIGLTKMLYTPSPYKDYHLFSVSKYPWGKGVGALGCVFIIENKKK